jgi:hypothetical protein
MHPIFITLLAPFASKPERVIKTNFVYPPIPTRDHDWCAWFDDDGEERGHYGWGKTEAEAIADLTENYEP